MTAPNVAALTPLPVFRFQVTFAVDPVRNDTSPGGGGGGGGSPVALCRGAFSECTGLEATMEPKVIKEGGRNYGATQRAGQVTFATVVLKRGMTRAPDLWRWWELLTVRGQYAYRLKATIDVYGVEGKIALTWRLAGALPVKFKAADLNARGTEVGIEELHIAHEGLTLARGDRPPLETDGLPGSAPGGGGPGGGAAGGGR